MPVTIADDGAQWRRQNRLARLPQLQQARGARSFYAMTDPETKDHLRENARRILRAKRGRDDHRSGPRWPLEIAVGVVVVAVLAVAVFVLDAHFF